VDVDEVLEAVLSVGVIDGVIGLRFGVSWT